MSQGIHHSPLSTFFFVPRLTERQARHRSYFQLYCLRLSLCETFSSRSRPCGLEPFLQFCLCQYVKDLLVSEEGRVKGEESMWFLRPRVLVLRLPSGEYRIRTDGLLHAKQALWPAELIPQPPSRLLPNAYRTVNRQPRRRNNDKVFEKKQVP